MSKWEAPGTLHLLFSPRPLASHIISVLDSLYPGGSCVATWSQNPGMEACELGCKRSLSWSFTAARADLTSAYLGSPAPGGLLWPLCSWFVPPSMALVIHSFICFPGAPPISRCSINARQWNDSERASSVLLVFPPSASVFIFLDGTQSQEATSIGQRGVACLLCVSGLMMASLAFQLYDRGSLIPALLPQDRVAAGQLSA